MNVRVKVRAGVLSAAVLAALAGCAAPKVVPPDAQAVTLLKQQAGLAVVTHDSPSFVSKRLEGGQFMLFGLPEKGEGTLNRREGFLPDPAAEVAQSLARKFAQTYNLGNVRYVTTPLPRNARSAADLARNVKETMVLQVMTTDWGLTHDHDYAEKYRFHYAAKVRLVDVANNKLLWQGLCSIRVNDAYPKLPIFDEIVANNGERGKAILSGLAQQCVDNVFKQFAG